MYIDGTTIIQLAAILTALATIGGMIRVVVKWISKQNQQDIDIKHLKKEQCLLVYGVLACLKGLKEQGCNGPVTEAIKKIEKHLNEQAHDQV